MTTENLGRVVGFSAYEIALQEGFVGTEAQWIESIKQPALDAAEIADTAASNANTATSQANTARDNANTAATAANTATLAAQSLSEDIETEETARISGDLTNSTAIDFVKDVYLKSDSDPIKYVPSYAVTSSDNTSPTLDGNTVFLTVNGTQGTNTLTVVSGNPALFTGRFKCVIFHSAENRYLTYYVNSIVSNTITLSTPLTYNAVNSEFKTVMDNHLSIHLSNSGYKAYGDNLYDIPIKYTRKSNIGLFQPELNPVEADIPLKPIGGATSGGFIPGTDLSKYYGMSATSLNNPAPMGTNYYLCRQQGLGKGMAWDVSLGGKSGYLEANLSLREYTYNTSLKTSGILNVKVILDGITVYNENITAFNSQIVRVDYVNVGTGRIEITAGDTTPTAIIINRIGWYKVNDLSNNTVGQSLIGKKVVLLGDSWTQFVSNGQDWYNRMKARVTADGGDPSNWVNAGRSGMTSKWARFWFQETVLNQNPDVLILEFFTNDANSSSNLTLPNWNFSSVSPYNTTTLDILGNVSPDDWIANIKWMANKCLELGIEVIILTPAYGGTSLDRFMPLMAVQRYYDVKDLSSKNAVVEETLTSKTVNTKTVNTDVLNVSKQIFGGTAVVGGAMEIFSIEANGGSSTGIAIGSLLTRTGGNLLVFQNGVSGGNRVIRGYITAEGILQMNSFIRTTEGLQVRNAKILSEPPIPEGSAAGVGVVGSLYLRNSSTGLGQAYLKESGTGNTGWNRILTAPKGDYADNAAAIAGGLVVGQTYTTGDLLKIVR